MPKKFLSNQLQNLLILKFFLKLNFWTKNEDFEQKLCVFVPLSWIPFLYLTLSFFSRITRMSKPPFCGMLNRLRNSSCKGSSRLKWRTSRWRPSLRTKIGWKSWPQRSNTPRSWHPEKRLPKSCSRKKSKVHLKNWKNWKVKWNTTNRCLMKL